MKRGRFLTARSGAGRTAGFAPGRRRPSGPRRRGECECTTASRSRGLEDGYTQHSLRIWTEKDFGKWTTNIGGGYDINPAEENRNWRLMGAMLGDPNDLEHLLLSVGHTVQRSSGSQAYVGVSRP